MAIHQVPLLAPIPTPSIPLYVNEEVVCADKNPVQPEPVDVVAAGNDGPEKGHVAADY